MGPLLRHETSLSWEAHFPLDEIMDLVLMQVCYFLIFPF